MPIPYYIIDSFTSQKFKGNPTPVYLVPEIPAVEQMHAIAVEMNLPVTAFCQYPKKGNNYPIRYFTVTGEISACGHATLATASILFELTGEPELIFNTIENLSLKARHENGFSFLTYPKYIGIPYTPSTSLMESLGMPGYTSAQLCTELETLFIETDNPVLLRKLKPDYKKMTEADTSIIEIVVTSISDTPEYDFLLRSFCPWIGIDEDPVTGSVHTVLAGFWKERLGKTQLKAYQASARGGEVHVRYYDDKTEIGGQAVTVVKGEIISDV